MFKYFVTCLIISTGLIHAGEINQHFAQKVNPEQKIVISQNSNYNSHPKLHKKSYRNEIGRTWYDYTDNYGRTIAHALESDDGQDGMHFVFMKRQPDATGNRYVTYNYWDMNFGLFFGNMSVTEIQSTGYGKIVNGKSDEVMGVMHFSGSSHLFKDSSEAGYTFTFSHFSDGSFPAIDRVGDLIILSNSDTLAYSTDYGLSWNYSLMPNLGHFHIQIHK